MASPATIVTGTPAGDNARLVAMVGSLGDMSLVAAGPSGSLEVVGGSAAPPDTAWLSGDSSTFVLTTLD
ncbi:MAG TPA: hypothetical protein VGJ17_01445, partial [Candidatus Limnocylindrales bacterium]